MGNVCSANLGQAPARQAALAAGIPNTAPSTTVNKVCSSGAKSIMLAAESIMLGRGDLLVAGGMENMSAVPYYIPKARFGYKYGNETLIDGLHKDGLQDPYEGIAMGIFADQTAEKYGITREEQDRFAFKSQEKALQAQKENKFSEEIINFKIKSKKAEIDFNIDEHPRTGLKISDLEKLKTVFKDNGTVTPGNSYTITVGAAGTSGTTQNTAGNAGGNSSAFSCTATGGGGGAYKTPPPWSYTGGSVSSYVSAGGSAGNKSGSNDGGGRGGNCLLYTSPSPRD